MIVSVILIFLTAFLLPGLISLIKAKIVGRKGPHIFQPLFDVWKLLNKSNVYSHTTGIIFRIAPIIYFATIFTAVFFIPLGNYSSFISFSGDFVLFSYLIATGRFLMIIGSLDTGSAFEGMGANREAFYSLLIEPVFFIVLGSFAMLSGFSSFFDIFNNLHVDNTLSYFVTVLSAFLLFWVSMIENSRMPVDDPKTHLELTMVHEVMVLDHSGFELALIHLAGFLKFAIFGTLIFNFMLPIQNNLLLQLVFYPIVQILYAVFIAIAETFRARNKMAINAQWIITLSALSVLVFITVLILTNKINF